MAKVVGMTTNRAIFLYHLRVNPNHATQITGQLKNSLGHMCAVGLGCDAFKIPMTNLEIKAAGLSQAEFSPYEELAKKLDITHADISDLYGLNDGFGMSFADVAKVAEEFFNSDQTEPVRSIRRKLKTEGKI